VRARALATKQRSGVTSRNCYEWTLDFTKQSLLKLHHYPRPRVESARVLSSKQPGVSLAGVL